MLLHHVAMRTRDLARLEAFYAGLLGMAVTRRDGERSVWLDAAGTIVMLERAEEAEPRVPDGTLELIAFRIEPKERAVYKERLAAHGVAIEAETSFTTYFRDPDGRRIALSHYPDEE